MGTIQGINEMSFEQWISKYYGITGRSIEEVEETILHYNRRLVKEVFEDEGCLSYESAKRHVIKKFQQEYIQDSNNQGFQRTTKLFW